MVFINLFDYFRKYEIILATRKISIILSEMLQIFHVLKQLKFKLLSAPRKNIFGIVDVYYIFACLVGLAPYSRVKVNGNYRYFPTRLKWSHFVPSLGKINF